MIWPGCSIKSWSVLNSPSIPVVHFSHFLPWFVCASPRSSACSFNIQRFGAIEVTGRDRFFNGGKPDFDVQTQWSHRCHDENDD